METITVASYDWLNEAEMMRIELEAHDIECEIADAEIVIAHPILANAVGGIKLKVPYADREKAKALIKEIHKTHDELQVKWCPKCESESIIKSELKGFFKLLSVLTFGLAAMVMTTDFTCNDCGHTWR